MLIYEEESEFAPSEPADVLPLEVIEAVNVEAKIQKLKSSNLISCALDDLSVHSYDNHLPSQELVEYFRSVREIVSAGFTLPKGTPVRLIGTIYIQFTTDTPTTELTRASTCHGYRSTYIAIHPHDKDKRVVFRLWNFIGERPLEPIFNQMAVIAIAATGL